MKLLSIRLHPFAGVSDRAHDFIDGAQPILAENEYGKSTLACAIRHALFTPTDLTPAKVRSNFGQLFPRGAGGTTDHCSVTLGFESGGLRYELQKTWSSARGRSASILRGPDFMLTDPDAVQKRLDEMRVHGEAAYTQVLLIEQDALIRTRAELEEEPAVVDGSIANVIARVEGEWDLARLRELVATEIDSISRRWNEADREPAREHGQLRDIDHPWQNKLGQVVKRYYELRRAERDLDLRRGNELRRDRLADEIASLTSTISEHEREHGERGSLVTGLRLRDRIAGLERERERLSDARKGWPEQEARLALRQADLERNRSAREKLTDEESNASRREELPRIEQRLTDATRLVVTHEDRAHRFREEFGGWPTDLRSRLDELDRSIREDEITLAEKRLRVSVAAPHSTAIRVRAGMDAPITLALGAGERQALEAHGRVEFAVEGVTIVVESGEVEVTELVDRVARNRASLARELASVGIADLATARKRLAQHEEDKRQLDASAKRIEEEKVIEELEGLRADEEEIKGLPESRSLETLRTDRKRLEEDQREFEKDRIEAQMTINGWKREFGVDQAGELLDRHDRCVREWTALKKQMDQLPPVPEDAPDLESTEQELRELECALKRNRESKQRCENDRVGIDVALNAIPATTDELESQLDEARRAFDEAEARLHGLRRLLAELDKVLMGEDRYAGLTTRVREIFGELTGGRYDMVDTDKGVPTGVRAGAVEFSFDQLSQGAKGMLAFAIRLALAELYLSQAPGFLVLDDPFVDLDPERLALAVRAVRNFAGRTRTQVVLLTCHPAQQQLFDKQLV